jgi:predicted outer membrane repeat protein
VKWLDDYRISLMFVIFITVLGGIELTNGATITIGSGTSYDFSTIQVGIDAAVDGDTVLVGPGEYVITEPVTFQGKAITVRSEEGRDETTIRMDTPADPKRGSVVVFENNETNTSVLEGFTITGGSGGIRFDASSGTVSNCSILHNTAEYAGGIFCAHPCSPRLIGCIIAENSAPGGSGGGVFIWDEASLTLINCIIMDNSAKDFGGGLCCYNNASMTLTDCIISGNSITGATALLAGYGGGVSCTENSSLTLTNCTISKNSAGFSAGGVMCYKSSAILKDCIITENSAARLGGAIFCDTDSSMSITNCIISGNSASQRGGGIECYLNSSIALTNCTIWGNSAGQSGGGVDSFNRSSVLVTNSIVMGNTSPQGRQLSVRNPSTTLTIAYSNIAGGQGRINVESGCTLDWDAGNIDADPCFADPDNDDYHLKSQAGRWDPNNQLWIQDDVTSPCIDAGDPMSPIAWESFPNGGFVNMGAFGGTPEASKTYFGESVCDTIIAGDINGDCQVNRADLEIMALHWTDDEPLLP